jgi:hypothetical protein
MYSYLLACSNEWMARNGISSGGDAIFRCQELRTAASLRMYRRAGWKKDGRRRNPIGWGRRRRREKGGGTAEPHQFRPPPQSCNAREEGEREDEAVLCVRLRFQSISEGQGSETSHAVAGIRERPRGIRAEFWA